MASRRSPALLPWEGGSGLGPSPGDLQVSPLRIDRARSRTTPLFAVALAAVSVWLFLSSDAALLEPGGGQAVGEMRGADPFGAVLVVLACAPVAVRRRWPLATLCAGLLPETLLTGLGYGSGVAAAPVLVLLYSVASLRGLAVALCALLLSFLAYAFAGALSPVTGGDWSEHLVAFIVLLAVWGAGRSLRLRRAYLDGAEGPGARGWSAPGRPTRGRRGPRSGRRIARELHDVVAHHVSVMTVQAARRAPGAGRRSRRGAREALSAIEQMGRTAMGEMRDIVGVLRTDGPGRAGGRSRGWTTCRRWWSRCGRRGCRRSCGSRARRGRCPPGSIWPPTGWSRRRLTNSLRHAGPGARAWVTVRHGPASWTSRWRTTGGRGGGGSGRPGHGLVGIRERVALYGGILRIGPRPGGGFEVAPDSRSRTHA